MLQGVFVFLLNMLLGVTTFVINREANCTLQNSRAIILSNEPRCWCIEIKIETFKINNKCWYVRINWSNFLSSDSVPQLEYLLLFPGLNSQHTTDDFIFDGCRNNLHRADRARQEVRHRNSIANRVSFQNNRLPIIKKRKQFNCVASLPMVEAQ